jgi:hypothetical protein
VILTVIWEIVRHLILTVIATDQFSRKFCTQFLSECSFEISLSSQNVSVLPHSGDDTQVFCVFDPVAASMLVEVEVTLRPTVSRPVRLGVLPLLEQVTRCYIYLSDNYFFIFHIERPL